MSDPCSNFHIPASNTVGGIRVTQTVLQCDIVKICISFRGHNFATISWIKVLFPLCICSMHVWTVLQVSNPYIKHLRRRDKKVLQCDMVQNMSVIQGDVILQKWSETKLSFFYAHVQCISELCFKFQVPASDTLKELLRQEYYYSMVWSKIYMSFKGM